MKISLQEDERIDDLERNGLKIIQNKNGFCFGIDAVLLAYFAAEKRKEESGQLKVIDLCTGTGIVPLLLYARLKPEKIVGLEIQEKSADMASRSVMLNDLTDAVQIFQKDVKEATALFGRSSFDVVTCNPPYIKAHAGLVNPQSEKAVARHEVLCTFEDVACQAAGLLRPGGKLYLVHRPQRLSELLSTLKTYKLEPKRLRFVHSFADSEATLVLIEAASGGNPEVRVERPLIVYKEAGVYTDEILHLYHF